MKSFYIVEVKYIPPSATRPARIKASCKGTSMIFSKEALENDADTLNNNPIHQGDRVTVDDLAAFRFVDETIIRKWNPMESDFHVIGKGEGVNGNVSYIVGKANR